MAKAGRKAKVGERGETGRLKTKIYNRDASEDVPMSVVRRKLADLRSYMTPEKATFFMVWLHEQRDKGMIEAVNMYSDLKRSHECNMPDKMGASSMAYEQRSKSHQGNIPDCAKSFKYSQLIATVHSAPKGRETLDVFDKLITPNGDFGLNMTPERSRAASSAIALIQNALSKPVKRKPKDA